MKKYRHVGIVIGVQKLLSPCCNAKSKVIYLPKDESGFKPFYTACSKCGKKYNDTKLKVI